MSESEVWGFSGARMRAAVFVPVCMLAHTNTQRCPAGLLTTTGWQASQCHSSCWRMPRSTGRCVAELSRRRAAGSANTSSPSRSRSSSPAGAQTAPDDLVPAQSARLVKGLLTACIRTNPARCCCAVHLSPARTILAHDGLHPPEGSQHTPVAPSALRDARSREWLGGTGRRQPGGTPPRRTAHRKAVGEARPPALSRAPTSYFNSPSAPLGVQ